jgi:hypothetical protein
MSDAGLRRRKTKMLYPNHLTPPNCSQTPSLAYNGEHAMSLLGDWSPHCPEAHKLSRRKLLMKDLYDLLRELLGAR